MLIKELVIENKTTLSLSSCDPSEDGLPCNPVYCLPDAYGVCNPDMDEDGGCDPHYDND